MLLLFITLLMAPALMVTSQAATPDHQTWDRQLKHYVRQDHRVQYATWKQDGLAELDAYLAHLSQPFAPQTSPAERHAALINAYNALTVRWVLTHFPLKSIWKTKQPFTAKRHRVDGQLRSLDDIETELRQTLGPLTHSALVCAARSCPPLRREAYIASRLSAQLDDNTRAWLANPSLNQFDGKTATAHVSNIFKWYRQDFDTPNSNLGAFLAEYGPAHAVSMFRAQAAIKIRFLSYDWGLNDTGDVGTNYRGFYLDYLRNK